MAGTAKIPKTKKKLQRPADQRHALARFEDNHVWVASRNRDLAEHFAALIMRGAPVTVAKTGGVIAWGRYAGTLETEGTIVVDRKRDGRFKVVPLDTTPNSLLEELAHLIGFDGTVKSEEGHHGLVFRGMMRSADASIVGELALVEEEEDESAAEEPASTEALKMVTGAEAIEEIGQKVALEFIESGVKVRIRGKRKDCETVAQKIVKGSPTVSSQQGAKYMIEGNLNKPFLRKGADQEGPDAHGVTTRDDFSERAFTAFGENLTAVQAACETGCKEGTTYTIVVNDRAAGYVVICSGKRQPV